MKSPNPFSTRPKLTLGAMLCLSALRLPARGEILPAFRRIGSQPGGNLTVSGTLNATLPAGSANYIQNSTTQQTASNFNISGNGQIGGNTGLGTTAAPNFKLHIRHDKFAEDKRIPTEEAKPAAEQGKCLYAPACQPKGAAMNHGGNRN